MPLFAVNAIVCIFAYYKLLQLGSLALVKCCFTLPLASDNFEDGVSVFVS